MRKLGIVAWGLLLLIGCGDDDGMGDADLRDSGRSDTGEDAPTRDAPTRDTAGEDAPSVDAGSDAGPSVLGCGDLPASEGTEVRIGPDRADELPQIVRNATPGTVILLEDGT